MTLSHLKKHVYILLDPTDGDSFWDKLIDIFIITLIILNVVAVILETVDSIYKEFHVAFKIFDTFSIIIFSLEYLLRIWSCTYNIHYRHPFWGRIKYFFSLGSFIDLIAIAPFFLPIASTYDFRFVRVFRIFRFLRAFKLGRYLSATKIIGNVFKKKKEELILCLLITFSLIVVASSFMYFAEHQAQPDKFSNIPEAMWWSVTTLTTVGYGDVYPITPIGRFLTSIISILGIGIFALPTGILASGFSAELEKRKSIKHTCPYCGKEITH
jgi:voltage-gated potassium channel